MKLNFTLQNATSGRLREQTGPWVASVTGELYFALVLSRESRICLGVTSKPANGCGLELDAFIPVCPAQASLFSFASSGARISGCDRGVTGGRAWRWRPRRHPAVCPSLPQGGWGGGGGGGVGGRGLRRSSGGGLEEGGVRAGSGRRIGF